MSPWRFVYAMPFNGYFGHETRASDICPEIVKNGYDNEIKAQSSQWKIPEKAGYNGVNVNTSQFVQSTLWY